MRPCPPNTSNRTVAAVILAVATTAFSVAACAPAPSTSPARSATATDAPPPVRLRILVGVPGAMRLATVRADAAGSEGHIAPASLAIGEPAGSGADRGVTGDARWMSGDSAVGYVATSGDTGRIYASGPAALGSPTAWREVVLHGPAAAVLAVPRSFAVLSPDGGSIAALAGTPGSGLSDARLLLIERATGRTRAIALGGSLDGRPPVWMGTGRVVVALRDRDDRRLIAVVDGASSTIRVRPGNGGCLAVSGDGSTVVSTDPEAVDSVATGSTDDFVAGARLPDVPIGNTARETPAQLLLDGSGMTLAVAWLDDAGDTTAIGVYGRGALGWTLVFEAPLPADATRAVLIDFEP